MPRTIAAPMLADLGAVSAELNCFLLELDFEGSPQYLTNAGVHLDWNGHTWVAVGGNLTIGGTQERWEPGSAMRLSLSGVDAALLALILQLQYRGRQAKVWWTHWDPTTGTVVSDPILLFTGNLNDAFDIQEHVSEDLGAEDGGAIDITTRVTERTSDVGRLRGVRTNVHSHQASGIPNSSDDTFFQTVATLPGKRIFWGTDAPYTGTIPPVPKTPPIGVGQPSSPRPGLPPQLPWGTPTTGPGFGHDPTGKQG